MTPSTLSPSFLLSNPALVRPAAPWCTTLNNLELVLLLLSQPWMAAARLRRADLERQLGRLAADMPLGTIYFQRVHRAVAKLEENGALAGSGTGRSRRFELTPPGFAALLLNLRFLQADPTLDGSEFELKRALVAMWNLVLQRVLDIGGDLVLDPATSRFIDRLLGLRVLGAPVVTDELLRTALDVLHLIDLQRQRVLELRAAARRRLVSVAERASLLRQIDPTQLTPAGGPLAADAELLAAVHQLAAGALPQLGLEAVELRYGHYLEYLDRLRDLYASELTVVDLNTLRRSAGGGA